MAEMAEMKKGCEEIRPLLVDGALGELRGADLEAVEEHLAGCELCTKEAERVAGALESLDCAPSVAPSKGYDEVLAARLPAERDRERVGAASLIAALVALTRRARRYPIRVAAYPVMLLAVGYVAWTILSLDAERRGLIRQIQTAAERTAMPGDSEIQLWGVGVLPEPAMARGEGDVFGETESAGPVALGVETQPTATHTAATTEPVRVVVNQPRTPEELAVMPELPPLPVGRVLPGPRGSTLALARFTTIRNAPPRLHGALSGGILWLCANQEADGSWMASGPKARGAVEGEWTAVEVTSAASLALMESGFSPQGTGRVSGVLRNALVWLVRQQRSDGMFEGPARRQIEAQAMACMALSESLRLCDGASSDRRFAPIAQRAAAALAKRQAPDGSWGGDDAERTGMALMALGSARAAGLRADLPAQRTALAWLDGRASRWKSVEQFYANLLPEQRPDAVRDLTYAEVARVLSRGELAWSQGEAAEMTKAALAKAPVSWGAGDSFRSYAATLAAYRLNGSFWQEWQRNVVPELMRAQEGATGVLRKAENRGSWEPHGLSAGGGRAYATALAVLSLTASCGHSPVYGGSK